MNRDVNANVCTSPTCHDGGRGSHHHTRVASAIEQVTPFDETHGGPMIECPVSECKQVSALLGQERTFKKEDPVDESLNAVQEDLISQAGRIAEWWVKTAQDDAEKTVPKAVQYGAADFDLMGQFMVALMGDKLAGADDAEKMRVGREMAVVFYLIGKMGRMVGAYAQGMLPSDDTLFDTGIYAMMLRRIRETGYWIQ